MEKKYYTVDFSEVENYMDIHEILKRDLHFPDYYGGNLDALWDCLTDMLGSVSIIEVKAFDELDKKFNGAFSEIIEVFKETKHAYDDEFSDRFFVKLVYQNGKREEIT